MLSSRLKKLYVATMMHSVARGLAIACRVDDTCRAALHGIPHGTVIAMRVRPAGPACYWQRNGADLNYLGASSALPADLEIVFKHLQHAWLLYTFQENTPVAFARNRLLVNGDVSLGAAFTRALNRLLALILPKFVARRALKRYPAIGLLEKLRRAVGIYLRIPLERKRAAL